MDRLLKEEETAVIEAAHLTKRYGKNLALKDVSFSIREREIVGLIGPNGAGKSTTMNILSGYLAPTGGQVRICGVDLLEEPMRAVRQIGYLPEMPPLYMDMTVEEQIRFACKLSGVKLRGKALTEYVESLCGKTHVLEMRKRLIKNLSKGYRQRVAVAQLLAGDPAILILDEPTVGLDPRQIREFRDLFLELGQSHTIIFSSHILSEINSICSRILIFDRGEILADGTPGELQRKVRGADVLRLRLAGPWQDALAAIRQIPAVAGADTLEAWQDTPEAVPRVPAMTQTDAWRHVAAAMQRMPAESETEPELTNAAGPDLLVAFRQEEGFLSELNRQIRLSGCEILLLQPQELSLEELYMQITRERERA